MRKVWEIEKRYKRKGKNLPEALLYDRIEIDNPDFFAPRTFNYRDRINFIIEKIQKLYSSPRGIKIGDFGCAQGNVTILLGEKGYQTTGIDINNEFIEYARAKQEFGDIRWIRSNFMDLVFNEYFDVAVATEILEHCFRPQEVLAKIVSMLKKGGYLIVTTPNGGGLDNWSFSKFRRRLPTFREIKKFSIRSRATRREFGSDSEDHLFLFTLSELINTIPENTQVEEIGYIGGNIIFDKLIIPLLRNKISITRIEKLLKLIYIIPVVNRLTSHNIFCILQKVK